MTAALGRLLGMLLAFTTFTTTIVGCSAQTQAPNGSNAANSPYVAFAPGEVDVDGGLVQVFALQTGRLLTVNARNGQRVHNGDVLATLDTRSLQSNAAVARAEWHMAITKEGAARRKSQVAQTWLTRLLEAKAADAASPQSVEESELALVDLTAQAHIAHAETVAAAVRWNAARQALVDGNIRAPVAGLVVRSIAVPFLRVSMDDAMPVFILLPDRPRIVRAEVDADFATAVRDGMSAEIVVGESPAVTFRAKNVHVAAILRRRDHRGAGDDRVDAQVVDCVLEVDAPALRVGQRVLVRFLRSG